jgi:hypothetical protein
MRIIPVVVFAACFFLSGLRAGAQSGSSWKTYRVQPYHSYPLNSKKILRSKKKLKLQNNIADFYLYRNGKLVKPPKNIHFDFFPAGCICFKYDDTLLLNSGLGASVGLGVGIKIYRDRFTSSLHANKKNTEIYKFSREDSVYRQNILAEPESQSLRLYQEPMFITDEVIIGEYRATYKRFYQKNTRSGNDDPCKYTVRIVFKCRVTGGINSMKSLTGVEGK